MSWHTELVRTCPDPSIGTAVLKAIQALLERDGILLTADANERTISSQLACYLKLEFPMWDVDVEYNRQGLDPKRIGFGDVGELIYPDIIIHRRLQEENLLAVEIKKGNSHKPDEEDMRKLRAYVAELGYRRALFIRLSTAVPDVSAFVWL